MLLTSLNPFIQATLNLFYLYMKNSVIFSMWAVFLFLFSAYSYEDAVSMLGTAESQEGAEILDSLYSEHPDSGWIKYYYAASLRNGDKAFSLFKEISENTGFSDSLRSEAYFRLGSILMIEKRYKEAKGYFSKSRSMTSDYTPLMMEALCSVTLSAGDADSLINSVLNDGTAADDKFAYCLRGHLAFQRGNFEKALKNYKKASGNKNGLSIAAFTGGAMSADSLDRERLSSLLKEKLNSLKHGYLEKGHIEGRSDHDAGSFHEALSLDSQEEPEPGPDGSGKEESLRFMIQAGAFEEKENALDLQKRLEDKGFSASVERESGSRGVFFKAVAGPYNSKEEAEKIAEKRLGAGNYIILTR